MQSMISLREGALWVFLVACTMLNSPLQKVRECCLSSRSQSQLMVRSLMRFSYLLISSIRAWWQCASSFLLSSLSSSSTVTLSLPLGLKIKLILSFRSSFCSSITFQDSLATSQLSYTRACVTFSSLASSRSYSFSSSTAFSYSFNSRSARCNCYSWSSTYSFSSSSTPTRFLYSAASLSAFFLASPSASASTLQKGWSMEGEKWSLSCWKGVYLSAMDVSSREYSSISSDSCSWRMMDYWGRACGWGGADWGCGWQLWEQSSCSESSWWLMSLSSCSLCLLSLLISYRSSVFSWWQSLAFRLLSFCFISSMIFSWYFTLFHSQSTVSPSSANLFSTKLLYTEITLSTRSMHRLRDCCLTRKRCSVSLRERSLRVSMSSITTVRKRSFPSAKNFEYLSMCAVCSSAIFFSFSTSSQSGERSFSAASSSFRFKISRFLSSLSRSRIWMQACALNLLLERSLSIWMSKHLTAARGRLEKVGLGLSGSSCTIIDYENLLSEAPGSLPLLLPIEYFCPFRMAGVGLTSFYFLSFSCLPSSSLFGFFLANLDLSSSMQFLAGCSSLGSFLRLAWRSRMQIIAVIG